MSSMDAYLPNLMTPGRDGNISMEAVGKQPGSEGIWTSNGSLKNITPKEIKELMEDEGALFTVGGVRCTRIIIVIVITVTINGIVIVIVIIIIMQ